jgi:diphosphomevalonate decarboxylase
MSNAQQTGLVLRGSVTARAHVNVALIKYWGKAPRSSPLDANLPAVPSLSLTLDELYTDTTVRFAPDADGDSLSLNGEVITGPALQRIRDVLNEVRRQADIASPFAVSSINHVPTAAGLASSASSMAALAGAAARCAGLRLADADLSALARLGSGSASRSIFGGWATWSGRSATALAPVDHWDVCLVVAMVETGPKAIGSRAAMTLTQQTSPLYDGWVRQAQSTFDAGVTAVQDRNLTALISAMELSTMRMHASALGATPPILYWKPASIAVMDAVRTMRNEGVLCGFTLDAGPNVKVLCAAGNASEIARRLTNVAGVEHTIVARPGPALRIRVDEDA